MLYALGKEQEWADKIVVVMLEKIAIETGSEQEEERLLAKKAFGGWWGRLAAWHRASV